MSRNSTRPEGMLVRVTVQPRLVFAIFTAASALCAAASSVGLLVAARALHGVGAAVMIPISLGLLLAAYPPEKRAGAVRAWAAVTGASAALGPVVGGLLVEASWRWV